MTCPICKTPAQKAQVLIPNIISVSTCISCDLKWSKIRPVKSGGGYEIHNVDNYDKSIGLVRSQQARIIVKLAAKIMQPKNKVWLDIGCGVGHLIKSAKKAGYDILGVDPDQEALLRAEKYISPKYLRRESFSNTTVPNASIDIISALDVLEHIPAADIHTFVALVHKKLRKGGLFVIKVPSTDGLYFKTVHLTESLLGKFVHPAIKRMWLTEYMYPHTFYFNSHNISLLLHNSNFKVRTIDYLEEIPNSTIIARIRVDNNIKSLFAYAAAPIFLIVNFIEKLRKTSDSMLIIAESI